MQQGETIITAPRIGTDRGFTLLELIVAIGIIGLLAAIAVSKSGMLIGYIQLSMSANTIKHNLICAKTRALGDSKIHCGAHFDTTVTPARMQLFLDNGTPEHDGMYTPGSDEPYMAPYVLPETVQLSISGQGQNVDIVFRGDGSTKVHGMVVTLTTSRGDKRTISVLPSTGRIKIIR